MIVVKDLKKDYLDEEVPTSALAGVSFTINKGDFVSIIGPSGSGKSTLLQILSFLDRPTGGTYKFFDRDTTTMTDRELAHIRNKEVGFIFQSFNLLSRLSVYENVEMPLLYDYEVDPSKRKNLIEEAVKAVGLEEKIYVDTGKLSGGQKQRVAIARALINNPNIIFADEPTGNLDSKSGAQIMGILDDLNDEGHTIILVTHETHTAEFADRIITLRDGVIESDKPITRQRRSKEEFIK